MPVSPEAISAFLTKLQAARPITHRKMFGGVGIYSEEVFFCVIDDDRLYFKTDAELDPTYDAFCAAQWVISEGPMPYREVPAAVLEDPAKLGEWIDDSRAAALRRKAAPKKSSKKKS